MKVAIVQMCSGRDPFENLLLVNDFVREATERGAELVCFPENVFYRGPKVCDVFDRSDICLNFSEDGQLIPSHAFSLALSEIMSDWKVAVSLGSLLETHVGGSHPYNSHLLAQPLRVATLYRKQHLFSFRGRQAHYDESKDISPGDFVRTVDVKGVRVGLSICYDLRFPELFREMVLGQGAQVLLVPAAFARETGEAHWHTLLRARAIENQSFVVASGQAGTHVDSRGQLCECYGNSVIYGPWGELVAEMPGDEEGLLVADLEIEALSELRERLPALHGARYWKMARSVKS